jgi:hypothetical protein
VRVFADLSDGDARDATLETPAMLTAPVIAKRLLGIAPYFLARNVVKAADTSRADTVPFTPAQDRFAPEPLTPCGRGN